MIRARFILLYSNFRVIVMFTLMIRILFVESNIDVYLGLPLHTTSIAELLLQERCSFASF